MGVCSGESAACVIKGLYDPAGIPLDMDEGLPCRCRTSC
jgi:hypothetical protein